MKALARIIPLLILLPLWNLSGQQGKPSETVKIDPALVTDFYNDCMKRNADEAVCKLESSDPDFVKKYGKQDETGKFVPIADEDRAEYYAHCMNSPYKDATDPALIARCLGSRASLLLTVRPAARIGAESPNPLSGPLG
jgi:hypothetical protein